MLTSKDPIVSRALNSYRGMLSRGVVVNAAARRITNPVVANAVREFARKVMNGEAVAPSVPVVENEMTDEQKRKRGWKQDSEGKWHTKEWKEDKPAQKDSAKQDEGSVSAKEKAEIEQMSPEEKAKKADEVKTELKVAQAESMGYKRSDQELAIKAGTAGVGDTVHHLQDPGDKLTVKATMEGPDGKTLFVVKSSGGEIATMGGAVLEKDGQTAGEKTEGKPEEKQEEKPTVDYGSSVQNTVNGIPAKEVRQNFSMGISTGSRDGDIKECYERASASQKEFGASVDKAAAELGMKVAKFDGEHPVIGDGDVFFTRPTLKKEARVREKMDENDAESEKTGKKNGGINDIVDINGSTLVLGDGGDFKKAIASLEKCGMEVVRVKNCFDNAAFEHTGYGDVKVNVRTSNGFVGEVIIADRYMTEQKMNGAGHGLYEVTRSLTKAIDAKKPDVMEGAKEVRDAMNSLSKVIYLKKGEDHSTFQAKLDKAVAVCGKLMKLVNDPENEKFFDSKFKDQLPWLIEKIKDPKTYDGYRAELKKRGM